jgi:hypothetical protein
MTMGKSLAERLGRPDRAGSLAAENARLRAELAEARMEIDRLHFQAAALICPVPAPLPSRALPIITHLTPPGTAVQPNGYVAPLNIGGLIPAGHNATAAVPPEFTVNS